MVINPVNDYPNSEWTNGAERIGTEAARKGSVAGQGPRGPGTCLCFEGRNEGLGRGFPSGSPWRIYSFNKRRLNGHFEHWELSGE